MKDLLYLFFAFMRIGGLTFGGGYAMLPMLQKELVDEKKWVTEEELLNYYAIGQVTPGIIAINTASFVGHKRKGILGSIFATAGIVAPSLVIITIIAMFLENFNDNPYVIHAFNGIRVAVSALILQAVIKLFKSGVKDYLQIALFILALILSIVFSISPIVVVVLGIISGILLRKGGKS